jgi:ornithine carbamoyltransferase
VKKDFLRILDLSDRDLLALLKRARHWKRRRGAAGGPGPLAGRTLAMIFQKASTRTRVSFEVGMTRLGGHALFLSPEDTQIGRGEPARDTARVLSRYADAIMIRTFTHAVIEEMAAAATVPVINGLTDEHHPCQILADLMTAEERGLDLRRMAVAYIGDGNNVANSWIEAAHLLGFSLRIACPEGFGPSGRIRREAAGLGRGDVRFVRDPAEASRGADVLYTDVWTSMGQEKERRRRLRAFRGYRIDGTLLRAAAPHAIVMHCLPAHRGEEITDEVMEGPQSAVFDEAENRLHVQMALLERLILQHGGTGSPPAKTKTEGRTRRWTR